jgi:hypothetical protein
MLQPQNEKQPLPPRRDLGFRLSAAGFRLSARGGALRGRTRGSVFGVKTLPPSAEGVGRPAGPRWRCLLQRGEWHGGGLLAGTLDGAAEILRRPRRGIQGRLSAWRRYRRTSIGA